jgi:2-polyprenyl-6-methoxyphenol hydroxylase-like FAD-dependent oxidoreductase
LLHGHRGQSVASLAKIPVITTASVPQRPNGPLIPEIHKYASRWQGAAREVVVSAIERRVIFGTPLAEYLPERLISGRLGMVGDAAHVASPMVGAGFSSGLEDGTAFVAAVGRSGGTDGQAGIQALRLYDEVRLAPNRSRVLASLTQTRDILRSTVAR